MPVFSPRPEHVVCSSGDNGRLITADLGTAHYTGTVLDELALAEAVGGYIRSPAVQTNYFLTPENIDNLEDFQSSSISLTTGMVPSTSAFLIQSDGSGREFGLQQYHYLPSVLAPSTVYTMSFWLKNTDGRFLNAYIRIDMESDDALGGDPSGTYQGAAGGFTLSRPYVTSNWTHHYVTFTTLSTEDTGMQVFAYPICAARAPTGSSIAGQEALLWGPMLNLGSEPLYFFDGSYRGAWTGSANASTSTLNETA